MNTLSTPAVASSETQRIQQDIQAHFQIMMSCLREQHFTLADTIPPALVATVEDAKHRDYHAFLLTANSAAILYFTPTEGEHGILLLWESDDTPGHFTRVYFAVDIETTRIAEYCP